MTFQQGALFTSLTVLQNVQLPMIEHLQLPPRALDELALLRSGSSACRPRRRSNFRRSSPAA